ncbi:MAG TPA: hypothetical protein VMW89_14685 [Desulfatiglandales bacterium]|nr:hypothetical protein [Desulfatiglandales bacterium]
MRKSRYITIVVGLLVCLFWMGNAQTAFGFGLRDIGAISGAYITHLGLHELGHQVVAEEVGAESPEMNFFTRRNGRFYPGLSTYKDIPEQSKLPYAVGGERMAGFTFDYALDSYRYQPTTFNKALLFFSCADFFIYTLLGNYVHPENDLYDPNLIREETGLSKGALLSIVAVKSLLNAYRIVNEDARFFPMIAVDNKTAAFLIGFEF